jgi:hypothetical protein
MMNAFPFILRLQALSVLSPFSFQGNIVGTSLKTVNGTYRYRYSTVNVQRTGTQHLSRNVQEGILRSLTRNLLLANIGQSFISVDKRGWARGAYRFLASASLT